ncbi:hypothetical protein HMPREF3213_02972 [Heyndrickxia coagulans]|uniref:Uncharacterized protein n=1 Tax=Heyndrickxia coagulans TaxID=1398 RepID=A0A133KFY0_HEYCO|nr:hypothetical protein HMPREF3213_02972 [Heyndrickxia coagulans]
MIPQFSAAYLRFLALNGTNRSCAPISYVYNMEMLHIIKQYKGFPAFLEE